MISKKLKDELHRKLDKQRPRPLMFIGWVGGKKCYVRKQSLSYFQLLKIYPRPYDLKRVLNPHHIFQKKHHLAIKPAQEHIVGYIIAASGIAFLAAIVIFYIVLITKLYL